MLVNVVKVVKVVKVAMGKTLSHRQLIFGQMEGLSSDYVSREGEGKEVSSRNALCMFTSEPM